MRKKNWSVKSESVLDNMNFQQTAFANDMGRKLPFMIMFTSATRSPLAQTQAMYQNIRLGKDPYALYKNTAFVDDFMESYPNEAESVRVVQKWLDLGRGSDHLKGMALDVRTRDLTRTEIDLIISVAWELGATQVIDEGDHIHISLPKTAITQKSVTALSLVPNWVWYVSVSTLAIASMFLMIKDK